MKRVTLIVPPSAASLKKEQREGLVKLIGDGLGVPVEVTFADSYDVLTTSVLSGHAQLAWAPPIVAARLESAGAPVVVRAIRNGHSTYRGALVTRSNSALTMGFIREAAARARRPGSQEAMRPVRAAWVDRESTGGYLLVASWLREQGYEPDKVFAEQRFLGSYQAALGAVLDGTADVCSAFGPPAGATLAVEEFVPGRTRDLKPLGFTAEAPNDGIAIAPLLPPGVRTALERTFLTAHATPRGAALIASLFRAERFELAPPQRYRALSRAVRTSTRG